VVAGSFAAVRKLGLIDYSGHIEIHSSLLNVVLHDEPHIAALADPEVKARLAVPGSTVLAGSPADFASLVETESEKWAKVVTLAGIKPE
jgi:hypothetical protein